MILLFSMNVKLFSHQHKMINYLFCTKFYGLHKKWFATLEDRDDSAYFVKSIFIDYYSLFVVFIFTIDYNFLNVSFNAKTYIEYSLQFKFINVIIYNLFRKWSKIFYSGNWRPENVNNSKWEFGLWQKKNYFKILLCLKRYVKKRNVESKMFKKTLTQDLTYNFTILFNSFVIF